ncbi:Crp/Fnr family transcriptional regulator [Paenibacillus arenosi]|uniref:Crp/Fnr family transcriptional regulator n=1 Tax=Paenibacillus arenosi TaxID=2774142 RepID=A0ABR9AY29_9BACL|nr:Crp/Fnr family transcriptional regulator [Paenibacillus arenosi]MBD8497841.1 Crp/Fnr family transcriptional regulator [Paenibacillus arenosi]
MIDDLRQVTFFQDLPEHAIQELLPKLKHRHFKKNHTIIYEEDTNRDIFIIRSGFVKVYRIEEDKEFIFNFFFPGETVGEVEAIDPASARIASIEAMDNVQAWMLSGEDFMHLTERYPSILRRAYCQLVDNIRVLNRKICYLSFMDVRRKCANLLLDLSTNLGTEDSGYIQIQYKFPHHVLANMIGVTRESLSKTLKEFQDEGIISVNQKTITIMNLKKMSDISESSYIEQKQRFWRRKDTTHHFNG